jgi:glycosyltransferase involved in cell wall biosynthesis
MASRCAREAQRLGVAGHVLWLGERKDVPRLLQALDLYALPTLSDMLPMAMLEAMWAELPILATTAGGIPEAITDGVHGWLVPPKDPDALARALVGDYREPRRARPTRPQRPPVRVRLVHRRATGRKD